MITAKCRMRFASLILACVTSLNVGHMAFAVTQVDLAMQTSQQSRAGELYGPIPESLRDSFIERMALFLKHRSSKNWTELYDLSLARSIRSRTKEQFVEDYHKYPGVAGTSYPFVSFSPSIIESSDTGQDWTIYGCAKLKGVKFKVDAFIVASREAGEWRFSDLDMLTPRDTPFKKCGR